MIHELDNIIDDFVTAGQSGLECVLATVVELEGSSYRRPGVRMLIREDDQMTGAVSGGCVEKEILRQSMSVFKDGSPKIMTYDGRYRLGCEGILFILIEKFCPSEALILAFKSSVEKRSPVLVKSYYSRQEGTNEAFGSHLILESGQVFPFGTLQKPDRKLDCFTDELKPSLKLLIIGAEHDAVELSSLAASCGWQVTIIAPSSDPREPKHFPGAGEIINSAPEFFSSDWVDIRTAVVLMTHSYVLDLQYMMKLVEHRPRYLGLLGPRTRREKLFEELWGQLPEIDTEFFDSVSGPAGINIGAETPREIAISVVGEILSVFREQEPKPLKDKVGRIHSGVKL
ncbi:XdhC family protein [Membranihabitans maritimus]|uniref:XdhC family protein n=1 Tax=Membranihabitans maritimus TaxID=2904244 RepID=UPI001F192142|nr:XdhC/CoxI family protein [Membranihabitans maritimus]